MGRQQCYKTTKTPEITKSTDLNRLGSNKILVHLKLNIIFLGERRLRIDDVSALTHAHSERLIIDNGNDETQFLAESVLHHSGKPGEVNRDIPSTKFQDVPYQNRVNTCLTQFTKFGATYETLRKKQHLFRISRRIIIRM